MAPKGKKKGRARKKKIKLRSLALGLLVGGGLLLTSLSLFLLSGRSSKPLTHKEPSSRAVSSKKQDSKGDQGARKSQRKEVRAAQAREGSETPPKVAIIIDDVGFDVELARSFLDLKLPLTLSILPTAPHAQAIAREAMGKGAEVLLHLPMEPKESNGDGPGSGALLEKMGEEEFVETLNGHLSRIPGIKGVNNHMGSLLTEREDKMALLFRELKKRHLFYVDSRTTPQTVASRVATEMKVPVASRSVFLDHDLSQEAMKVQWERLLAMARQHGHAVVIAHPHRETLVFLREHLQDLRSEARLVRVADIVN
ncbi:MAG TPA: divergent polysaccharide deacetylase family protein [Desulfatiglandales bacterium]